MAPSKHSPEAPPTRDNLLDPAWREKLPQLQDQAVGFGALADPIGLAVNPDVIQGWVGLDDRAGLAFGGIKG